MGAVRFSSGLPCDKGVNVRTRFRHLQIGGHHCQQAFPGSLRTLRSFADPALHLAEDHFAHCLLEPRFVTEVAVEHGL